jgi:hypothetical protein
VFGRLHFWLRLLDSRLQEQAPCPSRLSRSATESGPRARRTRVGAHRGVVAHGAYSPSVS